MPTPEFILELRKKVGHDLLWLMGVSGYVEDEQGRVLLGRRSDTGEWAMVYGINEPGEEPADTVAREVKEETGVDVIVTDLVSVKSSPASGATRVLRNSGAPLSTMAGAWHCAQRAICAG